MGSTAVCTYSTCCNGTRKNPLCRKCDAEKKTLVHILCECAALEKKRTGVLEETQIDPDMIKEMRLSGIMALIFFLTVIFLILSFVDMPKILRSIDNWFFVVF